MAEENVKIKVIFEGDTTNLNKSTDDISSSIQKVKKESADTTQGFGIMDTKMGTMWKNFTSGGQKAIASMTTLKGAIAATGIGLLVIAVAGLVNYFKQTEEGADKLEQVMSALGAIIREGPLAAVNALKLAWGWITGNTELMKEASDALKENINNVKNSVEATKALQAVEDKIAENLLTRKKIEAEIADLREKAFDQDTSLIEKKKLLNQVMAKENELYALNKDEQAAVVKQLKDQIAAGDKSEDTHRKLQKAVADLEQVEIDHSKSVKLINKQISQADKQLTKEKEEEQKRQTQIAKEQLDQQKKDAAEYYDGLKITVKDHFTDIELLGIQHNEAIEKNNQEEIENARKKTKEEEDLEKDKLKAIKTASIESAQSIANAVFDIQKNNLDARMQKELENENLTNEQKDEIKKKYAKKQQKIDIAQAIINGALSVTKTMAAYPYPINLIFAAADAIAVGAYVATIKSQKFALGGWINGQPHANGGTTVVAEQGEFIVNNRTMSNPQMAQAIMAMNNAGNTGQTYGVVLSEERVAQIAAQVVSSIPVNVIENDITTMQRKVQIRENKYVRR